MRGLLNSTVVGADGYVVPRHRSIYTVGQFKAGLLGQVFDRQNIQPGFPYKTLKVVRPAMFVEEGDDRLELEAKGVITLSHGEGGI